MAYYVRNGHVFVAATLAESHLLLCLSRHRYGVFKENGPFLCGYDDGEDVPYLIRNKFAWTKDHHMLYIDNPVGTGFSFTDEEAGYPTTDELVAEDLLEGVRQFMLLFPFMTAGQRANDTDFYAFGESYGGAYVVALAKEYQSTLDEDPERVANISFKGIGVGNGFISSVDQSIYADYVDSLGYFTDKELEIFRNLDEKVIQAFNDGAYVDVIKHSQESLHFFTSVAMNLTNIYDFTFDGNYLTNHEYVCFLQQDHVRRGIHVGGREFNKGYDTYTFLNRSIMASKKPWLQDILDRNVIEVLIYNGNLDVIVNLAGMNRVVKSLQWRRADDFFKAKRQIFWVYNEDTDRGEVAGYLHEGGGLTYLVVRNAGHMVPISQPRWARQIAFEFTHKKAASQGGKRFAKSKLIKPLPFSAYRNCSL